MTMDGIVMGCNCHRRRSRCQNSLVGLKHIIPPLAGMAPAISGRGMCNNANRVLHNSKPTVNYNTTPGNI